MTVLLLSVAATLWGCAPNPATSPSDSTTTSDRPKAPAGLEHPTRSGFLTDYSKLKPSPTHSGAFVERSEKLAAYSTFMVDLPRVLPRTTVRGMPIDEATAAALAAALKQEAIAALDVNFTVVDAPGAGVARLRSAVTQLAQCERGPGSQTLLIGGAGVEMEIVDSISGERLAAVVESDAVTTTDPLLRSSDPYYDAKLVFEHWSARLAKWLSDARQ